MQMQNNTALQAPVLDVGSGINWAISISTVVVLLLLPELVFEATGSKQAITMDILESMRDASNAKDTVRNVYNNIGLLFALLLTVAAAMLLVSPISSSVDADGHMKHLYVTATGVAFVSCVKGVCEAVINISYTEPLSNSGVLRYMIDSPGSVGGPLISLGSALASLTIGMAIYILAYYTLAAMVMFICMSLYCFTMLTWLGCTKSRFSARKGTKGSEGWQWAEKPNASNPLPRMLRGNNNNHTRVMTIMRRAAKMALEADGENVDEDEESSR